MKKNNFLYLVKNESNLIYFLMIFMMVVNLLTSAFSLPSIIRYISDIIVIILGFYLIKNIKIVLKNKYTKIIFFSIIAFFISTILSYFLNDMYSPFLYLWGIRNIFRFFIVFLCSLIFFNKNDINKYFKIIDIMFIINVILSLFQYFILNCYGDYVAGTFKAVEVGGNAGLLFILLIEFVYVIFSYTNKKCSIYKLLFVIITSIIVSVFAELKVFFVFFILIFLCWLLTNKFNFKILSFCLVSFVILLLGFGILKKIYIHDANDLTINGLIKYLTNNDRGYSTKYDLNRFSAFIQIDKLFFDEQPIKKIFGMGLGNTDVSRISIFRSEFYDKYEYLHHTWFMHSILYLETGYLGYFLYIFFFIVCIRLYYNFKDEDKTNSHIYNFGIVLGILCMIMTWYNSSLRSDTIYFVYIALAIPFIQHINIKTDIKSNDIILTRKDLNCYLKYEKKLYFKKTKKENIIDVITNEPNVIIWKYVKLLRISEYYFNLDKTIYRDIMYIFYKKRKNNLGIKLGIDIPENSIKKGLLICNYGNIKIDSNVRIGENCVLYGDNYIGINSENYLRPIIGNNVKIGIGSKIIGNMNIKDNSIIKEYEILLSDKKKKRGQNAKEG